MGGTRRAVDTDVVLVEHLPLFVVVEMLPTKDDDLVGGLLLIIVVVVVPLEFVVVLAPDVVAAAVGRRNPALLLLNSELLDPLFLLLLLPAVCELDVAEQTDTLVSLMILLRLVDLPAADAAASKLDWLACL